MRAASKLPISTVGEPFTMTSGGPTQVHISVTRAAGCPPMRTVGHPGGRIGPPTCGTGGTPGVTIGQVCISPILAAGGIIFLQPIVSKTLFTRFLSRLGVIRKRGIFGAGLLGVCRRARAAPASRARCSAAINHYHCALNCHASRTDIDKASSGFQCELHAGLNNDRHAPLEMYLLTGIYGVLHPHLFLLASPNC